MLAGFGSSLLRFKFVLFPERQSKVFHLQIDLSNSLVTTGLLICRSLFFSYATF